MAMMTRSVSQSELPINVSSASRTDTGVKSSSASSAFSEFLQSESKTAETGAKTSSDSSKNVTDRKDTGSRNVEDKNQTSAKAAETDDKTEDEREIRAKAEQELSILSSMMNAVPAKAEIDDLTEAGNRVPELSVLAAEEAESVASVSENVMALKDEALAAENDGTSDDVAEKTTRAKRSYSEKTGKGPASDPELLAKARDGKGEKILSALPAEGPAKESIAATGPAGESRMMKKPEPEGISAKEREAKRNGFATETAAAASEQNAGLKTHTPAQPASAVKTEATMRTDHTYEVETGEDSLVDDVTEFMQSHMRMDQNRMVLELNPRNLGKITIEVTYKGQEAHITMTASSARTAEILSQGAESMGSILTRRTGNETQVYVPQDASDRSRDASENREGSGEGRQQQDARQKEQSRQSTASDQDSFLSRMRLGLM